MNILCKFQISRKLHLRPFLLVNTNSRISGASFEFIYLTEYLLNLTLAYKTFLNFYTVALKKIMFYVNEYKIT